MVNGSIIVNNGKKILLNRSYKASPDYTVPSKFSVGITNGTPSVGDTALDVRVPITNGTVIDDGQDQLTGSAGGSNSTDNTSVFKTGAGETDDTAQNLIANNSSSTKTWTISALDSNFTATQFFSYWLYIKDATALAKFLSAGTALQVRIRTNGDAANLSYLLSTTAANLSTGWNFITGGTTAVSSLTQGAGGPPSGVLDEFIIEITTNNATDTFVAGDVVYDLMRQWQVSDLIKSFVTGYPVLDEANLEVTTWATLVTTEAVGFPIDGFALYNTDTTPLMHSEDTVTDLSKTVNNQFTFIVKDRVL